MGVKKEVNHSEMLHRAYDHIVERKPTAAQLENNYTEKTLVEIAKLFYLIDIPSTKKELAALVAQAARA